MVRTIVLISLALQCLPSAAYACSCDGATRVVAPTPNSVDVPTNARVVVSTWSHGFDDQVVPEIRLLGPDGSVAGSVALFGDERHGVAEFTPETPLTPNTNYEIHVDGYVVNGLASPFTFTTGDGPDGLAPTLRPMTREPYVQGCDTCGERLGWLVTSPASESPLLYRVTTDQGTESLVTRTELETHQNDHYLLFGIFDRYTCEHAPNLLAHPHVPVCVTIQVEDLAGNTALDTYEFCDTPPAALECSSNTPPDTDPGEADPSTADDVAADTASSGDNPQVPAQSDGGSAGCGQSDGDRHTPWWLFGLVTLLFARRRRSIGLPAIVGCMVAAFPCSNAGAATCFPQTRFVVGGPDENSVPTNSRIVIYVSGGPLHPDEWRPEAIALERGGSPVAVDVETFASLALTYVVTPVEELAPDTDYRVSFEAAEPFVFRTVAVRDVTPPPSPSWSTYPIAACQDTFSAFDVTGFGLVNETAMEDAFLYRVEWSVGDEHGTLLMPSAQYAGAQVTFLHDVVSRHMCLGTNVDVPVFAPIGETLCMTAQVEDLAGNVAADSLAVCETWHDPCDPALQPKPRQRRASGCSTSHHPPLHGVCTALALAFFLLVGGLPRNTAPTKLPRTMQQSGEDTFLAQQH